MDCITYTNNHTCYTEKIPVPLQRLMVQRYCESRKLRSVFDHNELYTLIHLPILRHLFETEHQRKIVLFSIFTLPTDTNTAWELVKIALQNGNELCFANEELELMSEADWPMIQENLEYA